MNHSRRALGQNFLNAPTTIRSIVQFGRVKPGEPLMEIGPGTGALTRSLLELSSDLVAVELDAALAATWLVPLFTRYPQAQLHVGDIRVFDPSRIACFGRRKVFGNLPYSVATHLVLRFAEPEWRPFFSEMIFMVQQEVAQRIDAGPGSKDFGYLSCICRLAYEVEKGFRVPPAAFTPCPKVDSRVLRLTHRSDWSYDPAVWAVLKDLLKQAFGQRRKTIQNNLKGSRFSAGLLAAAGISPSVRPEEIPAERYAALALLSCNSGR
ncbi:MAG: ribosomal RNA small subunit methyltransferase A [Acidobacteria bacterium]|nr:ribosomal RNA small subunit methyltransferase A [Acidobacteriota bacterium]